MNRWIVEKADAWHLITQQACAKCSKHAALAPNTEPGAIATAFKWRNSSRLRHKLGLRLELLRHLNAVAIAPGSVMSFHTVPPDRRTLVKSVKELYTAAA